MPCVMQPQSAAGYLRARAIVHLNVYGPSTTTEIHKHVPPYYTRQLLRYALATLQDMGVVHATPAERRAYRWELTR
jgi:hypothetical protein